MASLKMNLVLAAILLVSVFALPANQHGIDYTIQSVNVLPDDADLDFEAAQDEIVLSENDDVNLATTGRVPQEKAVFAVKKVESGYARTTRVGITVQKGASGVIYFRIRAKAVTVEQISAKVKYFRKSLSKSQKKELRKLGKGYDGGYAVPWLKFLGIDLSKKSTETDFLKKRSKTASYDELSLVAKKLLKETVAQKIEVKGSLRAYGVSFIPTTVFSFLRIARVYFEDDSKMLVLSQHAGDGNVVAATGSGSPVPSDGEKLEIIG